MIDGEPWFVARDVALALGYSDPKNAIKLHCKGVAKHHPLQTPGGVQSARVIREPDVYRLITKSKLESAERFESWVFEDVLPSIRRTGQFIATTTTNALNDAAALRSLLLSYTEQVIELKPKAAALDRIATHVEGAVSVREASKVLQMRPMDLTSWLVANRWIFKQGETWLAYQPRLDQGVLEHKMVSGEKPEGRGEWGRTQVRITRKGIARIAELVEKQKDIVPV
jgi:prophage antirepressor-like protein